MRSKNHEEYMVEQFRADPQYAVDFLNSVLHDGTPAEFLVALRQFSTAQGGLGKLSATAKINRTYAYKMLHKNANPGFDKISALLDAAGFQLTIEPKQQEEHTVTI
jgi:DNA-binding phage protein